MGSLLIRFMRFVRMEFLIGTLYRVRTRCPECGRRHVTVFRLRHISDNFFMHLGAFYRYAWHFDFRRRRLCKNSGQCPDWGLRRTN